MENLSQIQDLHKRKVLTTIQSNLSKTRAKIYFQQWHKLSGIAFHEHRTDGLELSALVLIKENKTYPFNHMAFPLTFIYCKKLEHIVCDQEKKHLEK